MHRSYLRRALRGSRTLRSLYKAASDQSFNIRRLEETTLSGDFRSDKPPPACRRDVRFLVARNDSSSRGPATKKANLSAMYFIYIYVYYRNNGASKECAKNSWKRYETLSRWKSSRDSNGFRESYVCVNSSDFYVSLTHHSQKYAHARTRIYVVTQLQEGTSLRNPVSEFAPRRQPLLISSTVGIMARRGSLLFHHYKNMFSFSYWFSNQHVVILHIRQRCYIPL